MGLYDVDKKKKGKNKWLEKQGLISLLGSTQYDSLRHQKKSWFLFMCPRKIPNQFFFLVYD